MGECGGVKTAEVGEWWEYNGVRIYIAGKTVAGALVCEHKGQGLSQMRQGDWWKHLVGCTGFDWVEETYPQYWTSLDNPELDGFVYAVRTGPAEWGDFYFVGADGSTTGNISGSRWRPEVRTQITKEQADKLLKDRRKAKEDDEWVTQDRVPDRPGIDEWRWVGKNGPCSNWYKSKKGQARFEMHGTIDEATGQIFEVRCRKKDLPPMPEEKFESSTSFFCPVTPAVENCVEKESESNPPEVISINLDMIRQANAGQNGEDQQRLASIGLGVVDTLLKKNTDYGGSAWETPILAPNMTAKEAIQCRISDKIKRLQKLLSGNTAQVSESVEDTMKDLAGYAILWLGCPKEKRVNDLY